MGRALKVFKYLKVVEEDKILIIKLNNPPANALSSDLMRELKSVLDRAANNKEVNLLIITAEGKFFSAGADVKELKKLSEESLESRKEFILKNNAILNKIENFPKPVLAFINGYALGGGCELALACHMRFASSEAKFGLPEIKLGVIPGWGGTWRLPKLIGKAKALNMILTGQVISAPGALEMGLIDKMIDSSDLLSTAKYFIKNLADKPREASECVLRAIAENMNRKEVAEIFAELLGKESAKKGIDDFIDKK